MKNLVLASVAIMLAAPAQAQHPCWSADRQIGRFLRVEEERFDSLASIHDVLQELERQVSNTPGLTEISQSVTTKVVEQRELARELMAAMNRLRFELQECSRR